jgi:tetratricopeptide (TPR) repeat protein
MAKMTSRALRGAAVLAVCCGVVGSAGVALADPTANTISEAEIEPFVQRGIDLRKIGRDTEALAIFEDALLKAPSSVRLKVHLAATHQALGQWVEADRYLAEALRQSDDAYVRRHRPTIERAYEFVGQRLGSLDVVGEPEGAELVLSGRSIGQLPLAAPVRVPIGSYVLEVRKEGYYSVTRPVAIGGGTLLRESVMLGPRAAAAPALAMASDPAPSRSDGDTGSPRWLTWTLTGTGLAAAVVSVVAFQIREDHAERWNSDACLLSGYTRGQVCPDELDAGRNAERWGIGSAVLSGVLLGGAATSFLLERHPPDEGPTLSLEGCGLGVASAACFGSF